MPGHVYVADFGDQADRGQRVDAAQAAQSANDGGPRPIATRAVIRPSRRSRRASSTSWHARYLAQHRLRKRIAQLHLAKPPDRRCHVQAARGPGIGQAAPQQQLADPLPDGHQIAGQVLASTDELAQRLKLEAGTLTGHSYPAACSRASLSASRVSVLVRSPGWRGIAPGAQTITYNPAARAALANPDSVGPAS
jgi:hypothetical protein